MHTKYRFTFTTHFHALYKAPHVFHTIASNDLDAMKAYCIQDSVQDMDMSHIEKLVITHQRMSTLKTGI